MHLEKIKSRLVDLNKKLEVADSSGQPTAPILAEINRLEDERDGIIAGLEYHKPGSEGRRISEAKKILKELKHE